ncbi:hypothetical protein EG832_13775 [bacterium]|nr:hypothetical protein [bacterium]
MKKTRRIVVLLCISIVLMGCFAIGGGSTSLAKKDLSKVVLQLTDVPKAFSNPSVLGKETIESFYLRGDQDKIDAYAGVSYLNPEGGINLIYSVVVVFDDIESAESVYTGVASQVNSSLQMLKDDIGDESLLFRTPTGTSFTSIWRYQEAVGYVAVITRQQVGFGYDEVLAASKLMQDRLQE